MFNYDKQVCCLWAPLYRYTSHRSCAHSFVNNSSHKLCGAQIENIRQCTVFNFALFEFCWRCIRNCPCFCVDAVLPSICDKLNKLTPKCHCSIQLRIQLYVIIYYCVVRLFRYYADIGPRRRNILPLGESFVLTYGFDDRHSCMCVLVVLS